MRTIIQAAKPSPELSRFVQIFSQRNIDCGGDILSQPHCSCLEQGLAFCFGGQTTFKYVDGTRKPAPKAFVFAGFKPPYGDTDFSGSIRSFAVFFKPLSLWPLLRIPSHLLAYNTMYEAEDFLGSGVLDLWSELAACSSLQEQVVAAERYLFPFAARARGLTLIARTAHAMLDLNGAIRVSHIASQSGMSVRQYERRFREEAGLAPKAFARIRRFQQAFDEKRVHPRRTWLSIAHEFGYFDQMHMVRDFQDLSGTAPSDLLDYGGDYQPWSLPSLQLEK